MIAILGLILIPYWSQTSLAEPHLFTMESDTSDASVTLEQITTNPERYVGQIVTVDGGVAAIFGPRAFTQGQERVQYGASGLLGVGDQGPPPTGWRPFNVVNR